jgi:hypothetical protein
MGAVVLRLHGNHRRRPAAQTAAHQSDRVDVDENTFAVPNARSNVWWRSGLLVYYAADSRGRWEPVRGADLELHRVTGGSQGRE